MEFKGGKAKGDNKTTIDARWPGFSPFSAGTGSEHGAYYAHTFSGANKSTYKMDHVERGLAIIFNHERFHPTLRRKRRVGTRIDADKLERRFQELGFVVQRYEDLSSIQVNEVISEASNVDHEDNDAFVCVILSHGEDGGYVYSYDGLVSLQQLFDKFRGDVCPSLVGKPKLFFIEAGRGGDYEYGVTEVDGQSEEICETMCEVDGGTRPTIPAGSDFFIAYSTAEGFYSHRNAFTGSWFVQELSYVLEKYGETSEICEMMTIVNRRVSQREVEPTDSEGIIGRKQMPCYLSMLSKGLYFKEKN